MAKNASKARPAPKSKSTKEPKSPKHRYGLLIGGRVISAHPSLKGAKGRCKQEKSFGQVCEIQDVAPVGKPGDEVPIVWRLVEGEWQVTRNHVF